MDGKSVKTKAFKAAFPHTVPILAGFLFLGAAYGILMRTKGFSFVYPMIMSVTIFGGSLEFVTVSMLLSSFAPLETLILTLMIQSRHLFYGLAMLDKYKGTGLKKLYLIFGMCDETFSVSTVRPTSRKGWTKAGSTSLSPCSTSFIGLPGQLSEEFSADL